MYPRGFLAEPFHYDPKAFHLEIISLNHLLPPKVPKLSVITASVYTILNLQRFCGAVLGISKTSPILVFFILSNPQHILWALATKQFSILLLAWSAMCIPRLVTAISHMTHAWPHLSESPFYCEETPWPSQLRKENYLVGSLLAVSEREFMTVMTGSMVAGRQAWCWDGSWEFTPWSTGLRQRKQGYLA